jgi:hypothetical protein
MNPMPKGNDQANQKKYGVGTLEGEKLCELTYLSVNLRKK